VKKRRLMPRTIINANGRPVSLWEFNGEPEERPRWWRLAPYFWSVLKGDLSLVGSEIGSLDNGQLPPGLRIRPGLTGLVQLHPRGDLSLEEKEQYHLYYVKNYSPLLDLEILFKTIFRI